MKKMIRGFLLLAAFGCASVYGTDFGQFEQQLKDAQQKIKDNPGAAAVLANVMGISQEEEIVIGRQIAGNLLGAAPLVKDNRLQKYVNNVGRWVAIQSERPDLPWHFGVIESDDINAFAAPGGYIFITRGLYKQLANEAALAGVLAHEIAHVVRQHHLKILQQSKLVDLGGKLVAQEVGGNDQAQKVIGSGAEIVARSLDKNAEFEADRMAVVLATRAGYDPYSLAEVLQQLGHVAQDDGTVALLFKTHPLPADRLDKLDKAMTSRFDKVRGQTVEQRFYRINKLFIREQKR